MNRVVDASVVVAALIDASAVGAWCAAQLARGELVAPHLMPFEAANVIRRSVIRSAIPPGDGAAAIQDLCQLDVDYLGFEVLAEQVWQLRSNLTAYDASYVATAAALQCPLLTLDTRLAGAPNLPCEVVLPT